jgi:hypothetical protein
LHCIEAGPDDFGPRDRIALLALDFIGGRSIRSAISCEAMNPTNTGGFTWLSVHIQGSVQHKSGSALKQASAGEADHRPASAIAICMPGTIRSIPLASTAGLTKK